MPKRAKRRWGLPSARNAFAIGASGAGRRSNIVGSAGAPATGAGALPAAAWSAEISARSWWMRCNRSSSTPTTGSSTPVNSSTGAANATGRIVPGAGTVARAPHCQRASGPSFQKTGSHASGSIASTSRNPAAAKTPTSDVGVIAPHVVRRLRVGVHEALVEILVGDLAGVVGGEDRAHVGHDRRHLRALGEAVAHEREQCRGARRKEVLQEVAHVELVDLGSVLLHELERVEVDVGPYVGIGVDVDPTVDVRVPAAEVHLHGSVITRSTGRFPCRTSRPRRRARSRPSGDRDGREAPSYLTALGAASARPWRARCPIRPCARIRVRSGPVMPGGCRGRPRGRWPWRSRESGGRGSAAARRSGRPAASAPSTTGSARRAPARRHRQPCGPHRRRGGGAGRRRPRRRRRRRPRSRHRCSTMVGERVARGRHHREAGPQVVEDAGAERERGLDVVEVRAHADVGVEQVVRRARRTSTHVVEEHVRAGEAELVGERSRLGAPSRISGTRVRVAQAEEVQAQPRAALAQPCRRRGSA